MKAVVLLIALATTACWDFVEPEFPEAGAPALLQATAAVDEKGGLVFDALLIPGLAIGGVQRPVPHDTLDVYNLRLGPESIARNGRRSYAFGGKLTLNNVLLLPFELQAPVVEGVAGPPPHVRWFGIRKTDPDTIIWTRNTDLLLHVQPVPGVSLPPPATRQWFLEVRGSSRSFRISADSLPPAEMRILAAWVPESDGDTLHVNFSFFQNGQQESPGGDYIGNFAFTTLLHWFVLVR